jgi:preprotein translocase subunit YajC
MPVLAQASASSPLGSLIFLGLMVVVFWLFIIRPQRTRMKSQQQLSASLEIGDRIQTIGGIKGIVRSLDEETAVIEVEQGKLRVARRAISSREPKGS